MAQVHINQVSKIYPGDVKAVDNISLLIEDREFVVLVGPSGCGKSTTLRMVAGLEEISGGTVSIGQRVVNDVPPKNRDIAMVFQNYALYPHMTVYKNMAFGLKLRGTPKKQIDQKVREAAAILGIEKLLDRKPKALSGGQRQRVAVGRAIVRDPACFLFDEPLSNLDAKLRVETRAEIKRLHHRLQTTTIYVTHDQEEAMTLGDRVVVMSEGHIQQAAPPLEVFRAPVNRFVAAFVGMPPMNFLDGHLQPLDERLWFDGGGVRVALPRDMAHRVAGRVGQDLVLGVRPESLRLGAGPGGDESLSFNVTTQVVEPLGSTMDLFATTLRGQRIVARVAARQVDPDTAATLTIDPAGMHIFEPGTYGTNLTVQPGDDALAVPA